MRAEAVKSMARSSTKTRRCPTFPGQTRLSEKNNNGANAELDLLYSGRRNIYTLADEMIRRKTTHKLGEATMRRLLTTLLAACSLGASVGCAVGASVPELSAGDPAPDFELPGSDGKTYKLSDFAGKQEVVIAWYPKAFTGG
jgi:hypothetical protein